MIKKKLLFLFIIISFILTGCSKTEKDLSFDADIYGTYEWNMSSDEIAYELMSSYTINNNNTYNHKYFEKSHDNILNNININGVIKNGIQINKDIFKLELEDNSGKNIIFYKYKNMLGEYYQVEIPNEKQFDLFLKNSSSSINEGIVFDNNGLFHYCTNYDNCNDYISLFQKYKYKYNHIYQLDNNGNWIILLYVVEDGLFSKQYTKSN